MSAEAAEAERKARATARRSAARLAAVQALYQLDLMQGDPEDVILDVLNIQRGARLEGDDFADMDTRFFSDVCRGAARWTADLDKLLDSCIAEGWSMERLERILAAILRCAGYELKHRPDVPVRVVINEYLDIARAFFDGEEPRLINGVLDAVARRLRKDEFDGGERGQTA